MTFSKYVRVSLGMALAIGTLLLFSAVGAAQNPVTVTMRDACDPTSFNAAVGRGTCIAGEHGTTLFGLFIGELTSDHIAGAWDSIRC